MSNPYFDPNADDDLFVEDTAAQGSSNQFSAEFVNDRIPEDMKNAMRQHVNIDLTNGSGSTMAPELKMITAMIEVFDDVNTYQKGGALIAAMAAVLDEMTNGKLKVYHTKYEAERQIVASYIVKGFSEELVKLLSLDSMVQSWTPEFIDYVDSYGELIEYTLSQAIEAYNSSCKELNVEPDEKLVTSGIYSVRDYITRTALVLPPGESDI